MNPWTHDELDRIGTVAELDVTSARGEGTLRPYVPVWVVRVGDDLYVRSYLARKGAWYQHVLQRHEGHIRADGLERDITVEEAGEDVNAAVDDAYRTKYASYGDAYVQHMTRPDVRATTLRLAPR